MTNTESPNPLASFLADPFDDNEYRTQRRRVLFTALVLVVAGVAGEIAVGGFRVVPGSANIFATIAIGVIALFVLLFFLWVRAFACVRRWKQRWTSDERRLRAGVLAEKGVVEEQLLKRLTERERSNAKARVSRLQIEIARLESKRREPGESVETSERQGELDAIPAKIESSKKQIDLAEKIDRRLDQRKLGIEEVADREVKLEEPEAPEVRIPLITSKPEIDEIFDEVVHSIVAETKESPLGLEFTQARAVDYDTLESYVEFRNLSRPYRRATGLTQPALRDMWGVSVVGIAALFFFCAMIGPKPSRPSLESVIQSESALWRWQASERARGGGTLPVLVSRALPQSGFTLSFPVFDRPSADRLVVVRNAENVRDLLDTFLAGISECATDEHPVEFEVFGFADGKLKEKRFTPAQNVALANDRAGAAVRTLIATNPRTEVDHEWATNSRIVLKLRTWGDGEHDKMRQQAGFIDYSEVTGMVNRRFDLVAESYGTCSLKDFLASAGKLNHHFSEPPADTGESTLARNE